MISFLVGIFWGVWAAYGRIVLEERWKFSSRLALLVSVTFAVIFTVATEFLFFNNGWL